MRIWRNFMGTSLFVKRNIFMSLFCATLWLRFTNVKWNVANNWQTLDHLMKTTAQLLTFFMSRSFGVNLRRNCSNCVRPTCQESLQISIVLFGIGRFPFLLIHIFLTPFIVRLIETWPFIVRIIHTWPINIDILLMVKLIWMQKTVQPTS